ncbi:MAG: PVC-type heme-binding CxxCH protein, partial [Verrucomicrobiota bacterium]
PPGFEIELVANESEGIGKFITVDWDTQGRMWSMTALEYPVDGNENPAAAKELYASRAKDKVLIFDRDSKSPTGYSRTPRIFAEGLAIPLGILPYKNGVYVQHGSDIAFLSDTDGDGKSDKREVILSGFGVQDSHLFPHQFTRGPGNWIWMAQGAFNYGKVRTTRGTEKQFDQTRMARFRYDGSDFDITSQGPCNIWGLVLTAEGECFIQEANDFGYPVMPFHEYANYPGCSGGQWKSYAPEFPGTAPDFQMGGTGLSGLALSDKSVWPEAYADVMYVANPITRKIQAIKITRDGTRFRYQKLPDFIQSSDEMFRPVSIHFGPDGCLYIVDWYNKIISHNEVPRNHADRDKKRGRIWRVKHSAQKPFNTPDFTKLSSKELLAKLGDASIAQHHLAWQAITDRHLTELAPKLKSIVADKSQSAARRIGALWAMEGLDQSEPFGKGAAYLKITRAMLQDTDRNIRREVIRMLGVRPLSVAGESKHWSELFDALDKAATDPDPEVRSEVIKTTAQLLRTLALSSDSATAVLLQNRALPLLVRFAAAPLAEPMGKSTQTGKPIKVGQAYEREFERYLVRLFLEQNPTVLLPWLDSDEAKSLPIENRLLATLALEPKPSAARVAKLLPSLSRPPGEEEVLRLAEFVDEPGVGDALKAALENPGSRDATLEALLNVRNRFDATKLKPILIDTAMALWSGNASARKLTLRLTSSFKLSKMERL